MCVCSVNVTVCSSIDFNPPGFTVHRKDVIKICRQEVVSLPLTPVSCQWPVIIALGVVEDKLISIRHLTPLYQVILSRVLWNLLNQMEKKCLYKHFFLEYLTLMLYFKLLLSGWPLLIKKKNLHWVLNSHTGCWRLIGEIVPWAQIAKSEQA